MQCPQCHNDVPVTDAQFGALYTCPKCMGVYFVNFDGVPEYGSMDIPLENSSMEDSSMPNIEGESFSEESLSPDFSLENASEASLEGDSSDFNALDNPFEPQQNVADSKALSKKDDSVFGLAAQEITDYGNQEEVVSNISYDLSVKGLDSKEVMTLFKEAIEDSKFAWTPKDILGGIKNGECTISNLNPIQAYVLAQRLQFLDLEIDWQQHAVF